MNKLRTLILVAGILAASPALVGCRDTTPAASPTVSTTADAMLEESISPSPTQDAMMEDDKKDDAMMSESPKP